MNPTHCSITHSPCPNWNRRSESALPLLNSRCETAPLLCHQLLNFEISIRIIYLCLCLYFKVERTDCNFNWQLLFVEKCVRVPNKKVVFCILFLFLPLGLFIRSTIDTGLNKCMTPMALWRQSELYFWNPNSFCLTLWPSAREFEGGARVSLHAPLYPNMYKYSSS